MNPSPPKINGYKIVRQIGSGGFSTVFLVQEGNQFYAAKVIPKVCKIKIANNKNNKDFIEREIKVMQKSNHPNIAYIINLLSDQQNVYIIEEYIHNSLFDIIEEKKKSFMEFTARPIISHILQAVFYLHSIGFCHRDIKPHNILIKDDGTIVIIDFGLATSTSVKNVRCGSKHFFPPEVMQPTKLSENENSQSNLLNECSNSFNSFQRYEQNQNNIDIDGIKCDSWSCGVTFFLILTGKMPWSKMTFDQITSEKIQYPPYLSNECKDFLDKLLTVNPKRRITIEEALHHKWLLKNASLTRNLFLNKQCNRLSSEKIENFLTEIKMMPNPITSQSNIIKDRRFRNNENDNKNQNSNKLQVVKSNFNMPTFEEKSDKRRHRESSFSSSFIDDDLNSSSFDAKIFKLPKNNDSNPIYSPHKKKTNEVKPICKKPIFNEFFHEEKERTLNNQVENIFQKINALKKSKK